MSLSLLNKLKNNFLILDGSMGALLQRRGLPAGMSPDVWMLDNLSIIQNVHNEYIEAGSDIILTNTFGASKWRLDEYHAYDKLAHINQVAVDIARKAAKNRGFIAGNIGPSGETIFPTGSKNFDEVAHIIYEQAKILISEGVDLIVIETMFDSLELRAALSGVRAASNNIPIFAHATFNTDARTDTGATPENIAAIAEGFHCQAVGVNCSTGPDVMVPVVKRLSQATNLAVCVQPNAGLPFIKDGQTVFPMTPLDMLPFVDKFVEAGASIIGGCCGTLPEYINLVYNNLHKRQKPQKKIIPSRVIVSSLAQSVCIGGDYPFVSIGERMNPSGRKALSASLKKGEFDLLLKDAELQINANAQLLDLNVGVPLVDEPELLKQATVAVQNIYPSIPLMLDSANGFALQKACQVYYGRPLINSINAEAEKIEEMLPILRESGGAVVALLTGVEVPQSAEERLKYAQQIAKVLFENAGMSEQDVVFDCLGLVVSAMREGSKETLRTISFIKEYFPSSATTLGLSNTSFGLPNRKFVHGAFLAAAVVQGLDSAIMSVTDPIGVALAQAATLWSAKNNSVEHFIENYSEPISVTSSQTVNSSPNQTHLKKNQDNSHPNWINELDSIRKEIFFSILDGKKEECEALITSFSKKHPDDAMNLFLNVMTPAIRHLGDLFGKRIKFIPHLIAAANAMKSGVAILEPLLIKARAAAGGVKETIIFATVKGDIHDIGKNICVLMLRNFGYEVIDLGRNVDADLIIQTGIKKNASILALSALMTTTMMQMKVVVDQVKKNNLPFKVMIGGAVVTPEFAKEIQADGFSTDVGTVMSEVERVLSILNVLPDGLKTQDSELNISSQVEI